MAIRDILVLLHETIEFRPTSTLDLAWPRSTGQGRAAFS